MAPLKNISGKFSPIKVGRSGREMRSMLLDHISHNLFTNLSLPSYNLLDALLYLSLPVSCYVPICYGVLILLFAIAYWHCYLYLSLFWFFVITYNSFTNLSLNSNLQDALLYLSLLVSCSMFASIAVFMWLFTFVYLYCYLYLPLFLTICLQNVSITSSQCVFACIVIYICLYHLVCIAVFTWLCAFDCIAGFTCLYFLDYYILFICLYYLYCGLSKYNFYLPTYISVSTYLCL